MSKLFRIGIVGCGEIGVRHARTYAQMEGAKVAAVTDVNPAAAQVVAAETGAQVFASAGELLARAGIDFLDVCTPPSFHREAEVPALAKGLPVICEKPLASSSADARAMVEAASKAGVPFMTAFGFRFHPGVRRVKTMVQEGALGRPLMYRNRFAWRKSGWEQTWRADRRVAGGGLFWDMGVHATDLFRFFWGDIRAIRGRLGIQAPVLKDRGDKAVEDAYVCAVESEGGILGTLEGSFFLPVEESLLTVYGEEGTLTLGFFADEHLELRRPGAKEAEILSVRGPSMFKTELGHWLAVLRGEEKLSVTGEDGLRAVEIVERIWKEWEAETRR